VLEEHYVRAAPVGRRPAGLLLSAATRPHWKRALRAARRAVAAERGQILQQGRAEGTDRDHGAVQQKSLVQKHRHIDCEPALWSGPKSPNLICAYAANKNILNNIFIGLVLVFYSR
jgi:hypothetical protein